MTGKIWRSDYDSLEAMLAAVEKPLSAGCRDHSRSNQATNSWDYRAGFKGALKLARYGWPEGREQWADEYRANFSQFQSERPPSGYDLAGDRLDPVLAAAGDPEPFISPVAFDPRQRVITILVSCLHSAAVSSRCIHNRGLAILATIDNAEAEGRRVELRAAAPSEGHIGDDKVEIYATIKRADEPVDIDRLAYVLAHPAFGRRILFGAMEICGIGKDLSSSYGHTYTPRGLPPSTAFLPGIYTWKKNPDEYATPTAAMVTITGLLQSVNER